MKLERVAEVFNENFTAYGELGASVAVWLDGRLVLSLAGGFRDLAKTQPWTEQTAVLFWSASKGPAAACVLHTCQERGVELSTTVAEFWPEFAANGKERVAIDELMSHRAGLPALSREVSVLDYDAVVTALAAEARRWPPDYGHGYHPRTFGFLLDELVRRVSGGTTLQDYWRSVFAEPLGLDLWFGVPLNLVEGIAPIFPARTPPDRDDEFYRALLTPGSLTAHSFASPRGLRSVPSMNTPEARTRSFPAFGGIGTAHSLARFYATLASGGSLEGREFFKPPALDWMFTTLAQGKDRVLHMDTAFSAGFMRDPVGPDGRKSRAIFGPSLSAFGHPGAGGSVAFADPENRIAFAYVMNQMEPCVMPSAKALRLIDALYEL